jgi:hypothetical protein
VDSEEKLTETSILQENDTPAAISKGADVDLFIIYYFKFQNSMFKFSQ